MTKENTYDSCVSGEDFIRRVFSEPVLIGISQAERARGQVAEFTRCKHFEDLIGTIRVMDDEEYWPSATSWEARYKPYEVRNGVLQIPVTGVLLNHLDFQVARWVTGYQYIERALSRGLRDSEVRGIALIVDSPGGEVAGNFEITDKIYEARGKKPIRAFVADSAYSGGCSIATAASEVIVSRSAGMGSVGVVVMHTDISGQLQQEGVKITFVKAGEHKVEGNSFEPLSDRAKGRIQQRVDKIYGEFVGIVSRNCSIEQRVVREMEADTYDAEQSIAIGLASRIGDIPEEIASFAEGVAKPNGALHMSETDKTVTIEAHERGVQDAHTEGRVEGAQAERERFLAVMQSEEYTGRESSATTMLSNPAMQSDDIVTILAGLPRADVTDSGRESAPVRNHFEESMNAIRGPEVGIDPNSNDDDGDTPKTLAAEIIKSSNIARGIPPKQ